MTTLILGTGLVLLFAIIVELLFGGVIFWSVVFGVACVTVFAIEKMTDLLSTGQQPHTTGMMLALAISLALVWLALLR